MSTDRPRWSTSLWKSLILDIATCFRLYKHGSLLSPTHTSQHNLCTASRKTSCWKRLWFIPKLESAYSYRYLRSLHSWRRRQIDFYYFRMQWTSPGRPFYLSVISSRLYLSITDHTQAYAIRILSAVSSLSKCHSPHRPQRDPTGQTSWEGRGLSRLTWAAIAHFLSRRWLVPQWRGNRQHQFS